MHKIKVWYNEQLLKQVSASLTTKYYDVKVAKTRQEALNYILKLIPASATVGVGGSITINELGLKDQLRRRGNKLIDPFEPGIDKETSIKLRFDANRADYFLSSANAITKDGLIVNIDGSGNRVGSTIFGPGHVIFIIGVNKVTPDLDSAIYRAHNYVAVANAKRLNMATPCVKNGECSDCQVADRICCVTVIFERAPRRMPSTVVLVNEELGL